MPVQDSPLVQIALIDMLVQLNARDAAPDMAQTGARHADGRNGAAARRLGAAQNGDGNDERLR